MASFRPARSAARLICAFAVKKLIGLSSAVLTFLPETDDLGAIKKIDGSLKTYEVGSHSSG